MITSFFAQTGEKTHLEQPTSSLRYDWIAAVLSLLGVGGSYLDLWAHTHIPQLETFFTPWHAVLYGSFLLYTAFLVGTALFYSRHGYPWQLAMPKGYGLSLLGALVFAIAGVVDLLWHTFFGIEKSIDALLSPTHLGLAANCYRAGAESNNGR